MCSSPNSIITIITTTIITTANIAETMTLVMGPGSSSCPDTAATITITTTIITASIAAIIEIAPSADEKQDRAVLFFCALILTGQSWRDFSFAAR